MRGRKKRLRDKRWASLRSATTYTIGRLVLSLRSQTYEMFTQTFDYVMFYYIINSINYMHNTHHYVFSKRHH